MFFNKKNYITEENIKIQIYGDKISKKLNVFYNPKMKLNRDISLLVIENYFNKPIKFCDPMAASGIRELRFLKTIPEKFDEIVIGDISKTAIKNIKKNFKINKISSKNVKFLNENAINTINSQYFNFIEIDPFGSPIPFLDSSAQKIKHGGILSITATDTAALCSTYPKTCFRKYGIKTQKVFWYEELGLRNLIAYSQIQLAKYDKVATPILTYSNKHYYKIFLKIEESKTKSIEILNKLKYLKIDNKNQDLKICDFEEKNSFGKTYVGKMQDKNFLKKIKENINLIKDEKEVEKLLNSLIDEVEIVAHYNISKLQKNFKFTSSIKFEELILELKKKKFIASRPHNNLRGIKTDAKSKDIIKIMKNKK